MARLLELCHRGARFKPPPLNVSRCRTRVWQCGNHAQDRLLSYGGSWYTYNSNSDLTSKTQNNATVTYDYDVFGNLRHVVLDNGQVIEYVIDARNRRIGKKIDGTLVQAFLYDDQLRPIAELDGSNSVVATYIYGGHVNVPELIVKGGTTYRIVHDHLGSPRLVVDQSAGAVVQRIDYDEWGIVTLDTNPGFQPFGFAGGIYDSQTRLIRFGARDYDPRVGRWTARDPIGFAGTANLYEYAVQNPVDVGDPTGLRCEQPSAEFSSGPWGHRPEACLCDRSQLAKRAAFLGAQLGRMESGRRAKPGRPAGQTERYLQWLDESRALLIPVGPFDPKPVPTDPCLRYCVRAHEWVHYTDRRPVKPEVWDPVLYDNFQEIPAWRTELGCVMSFL